MDGYVDGSRRGAVSGTLVEARIFEGIDQDLRNKLASYRCRDKRESSWDAYSLHERRDDVARDCAKGSTATFDRQFRDDFELSF